MINDPSLSRQHAFVTRKGKKLFVHDLNSSNGTTLDGNPIIFAQ
ncbi:MAG: FHA domain-containing protein, partial [Blastochloris sp.]|nr:FHA domain-containing protein [Blastochloris sp.]